jgi:hypothetical protein
MRQRGEGEGDTAGGDPAACSPAHGAKQDRARHGAEQMEWWLGSTSSLPFLAPVVAQPSLPAMVARARVDGAAMATRATVEGAAIAMARER